MSLPGTKSAIGNHSGSPVTWNSVLSVICKVKEFDGKEVDETWGQGRLYLSAVYVTVSCRQLESRVGEDYHIVCVGFCDVSQPLTGMSAEQLEKSQLV